MKVNLVGFTFNLGSLLWRYGVEAYEDCINPEFYDLTVFGGIWKLKRELMDKPCIALAIGSDIYHVQRQMDLLMYADLTLIAHEAMRPHVRHLAKRVEVWKMPFDSKHYMQHKPRLTVKQYLALIDKVTERDVLIYCLSPMQQDITRILDFVRDNPLKEITMLGSGYQDCVLERFENVFSIRRVPHGCMPYLYKMHREYRQYYRRHVDQVSIMACEALYMGLKVVLNDVELTEIPPHRFEDVAIPQLIKYMESIL